MEPVAAAAAAAVRGEEVVPAAARPDVRAETADEEAAVVDGVELLLAVVAA